MWSNNSGAGYDQGGGYMNSPNVGGSQPQQKQSKPLRAQSIMPCTMAMIQRAEQADDKFTIDGIDLNQVVLVGLVRSANETATRLDYTVDDMTGPPLEVRQFVDNDENTPEDERTVLIRENIYVRVHGHVRAFAGKRSVVAFRVSPIVDMNEVTTHILEVIHAHVYLTRNSSTPMDTSTVSGSKAPSTFDNGGGETGFPRSAQLDIGLNPQQQQVLNAIRTCMDEQGISIAVVCSRLKSMSQTAIRDAVDFLSSEGHIYSTVDDEHYKSTDSC
jgi:replication factor A2